MSSVRNAVQRRNHKERAQPAAREKLGLLEKKKDYLLRAKDFHSKQNRLKAMREKAFFKNPNEFYFGMINSKTKNGVHVVERNEKFSGDFLKLLKTQDVNYVAHKRNLDKKKIEKLKANMHIMEADAGEGVDGEDEFDADFLGLDGTSTYEDDSNEDTGASSSSVPKHTVFVDDEDEVKSFEPAKHFDTLPDLVGRKYNRPRTAQLESEQGLAKPNKRQLMNMAKAREARYREFASRLEREETLRKLELEMTLQKNLMTKGRRKKVGTDADGLPKYKWKADRKK